MYGFKDKEHVLYLKWKNKVCLQLMEREETFKNNCSNVASYTCTLKYYDKTDSTEKNQMI